MASPIKPGKKSVDLRSEGAPPSRIRRDPLPVARKDLLIARDERERMNAIIGVVTFALAIFVILIAVSGYAGWSPRDYTAQL